MWAFLSAGVVDPRTGDITYANELPGWGGECSWFCSYQRVWPSVQRSDVRAHALGEARHGAGHGKDSVLTVAAGIGHWWRFVNHLS